jgi:hypothetical protein
MKRNSPYHDDSFESDAVWQLLDQAVPRTASVGFVADTVRAARLEGQARPGWWHHLWSPAPLAGLAATAVAAAVAIMVAIPRQQAGSGDGVVVTPADSFESIQQLAEEETLTAALQNPEDFSDAELVYLIGM